MTRLYWVEDLTQSVWNVCIEFDTLKNIENCNVLEENDVKRKRVNRESKSQEPKI